MNVFNEWLYKQWRHNKDSMVSAFQELRDKERTQLYRSVCVCVRVYTHIQNWQSGLEDSEEDSWNDQRTWHL